MNIDKRSVRRHCIKNGYKTRKVKSDRGKDGWEIALSSLPAEVLKKVDEAKKKEALENREEFKGLTERQKKEAIKRMEILNKWYAFAAEKEKKPWQCVKEFLAAGLIDSKVCRATLFNYKKDYEKGGLAELAPGIRQKSGVSEDTFSPEALEFISNTWLTQNQLSIRECFKKCRKVAKYKDWKIGSYSTAKRFCNSIPPDIRLMRRNGPKKFEDFVVPYIPRDPDSLEVMELIECDHHQMDVACRYHDGRIIFPWLTPWIDVRSFKPLGWCLCEKPNSDSIAMSYYKATRTYGLSKAAHVDNGKDFLSKILNGSKIQEVKGRVELNPMTRGIWNILGLKVHHAIPYNAKTKVIERFFGILAAEFSKWMRGYRGRNVVSRPEKLKTEIKEDNILTFDELKDALGEWLAFEFPANREMWGKYHEGRMPNEVFYDNTWTKRMVREDELMLLLTAHPQGQKVKQNGLWWQDGWYWSEKLHCNHFGQKVWFRPPPDDETKIFVFDEQDRYIDTCERISPAAWNEADKEVYRKFNRMKKLVRENEERKYKELVPNPMSDAERESLVVDREAMKKYKEPTVPGVFVTTQMREAIDKDKAKKINEAVMKKRQKDLDQRLREMVPDEVEPSREEILQQTANQYLRDIYLEE